MKTNTISAHFTVNRLFKTFVIFTAFCMILMGFETAHAANKKQTAAKAKVAAKAKTKIAQNKLLKKPAVKFADKKHTKSMKAVAKAPAGVPMKLPVAKAQVANRQVASLSAGSGISDSQKSLEIRGQSRNLSMLLTLKNRHENIEFVKPRETYRAEIEQTDF